MKSYLQQNTDLARKEQADTRPPHKYIHHNHINYKKIFLGMNFVQTWMSSIDTTPLSYLYL